MSHGIELLGITGTFFLEFWKREEAGIQFKWNLLNFQEEEEPPRPEYLMRLSNSKFKKRNRISGVSDISFSVREHDSKSLFDFTANRAIPSVLAQTSPSLHCFRFLHAFLG